MEYEPCQSPWTERVFLSPTVESHNSDSGMPQGRVKMEVYRRELTRKDKLSFL